MFFFSKTYDTSELTLDNIVVSHLFSHEACCMTYPHLRSVCDFVITLGKGKTTCPLLVVLHHSVHVKLFRLYWTALSNQTDQLLSDKS